ncbi:hypothetical protein GWI33_016926 [Rhynchophorus ferrugineus]|uniref:Uncharacterized protein n=1 Tax=Rhynchophorus ferrugineus TaxID=354439 RepID=A0A834I029_RHYFE|nr:hypothetical protein GWI33_016926 [Rhynchophorus ferrugineus]
MHPRTGVPLLAEDGLLNQHNLGPFYWIIRLKLKWIGCRLLAPFEGILTRFPVSVSIGTLVTREGVVLEEHAGDGSGPDILG